MTDETVVCPLCGAHFDPEAAEACSGCPVGGGCGLVCCPKCHYSWVNPDRTAAARWLSRAFGAKSRPRTIDG